MAIPARIAPISPEDMAHHDPGAGSTEQSFTRSDWQSGTKSVKRMSAQRLVLMDAPLLPAAARGAFYELHNGAATAANLTAELALAHLAKHGVRVYNIEKCGMTPDNSSDAVAEENVDIWDDIVDEIDASLRPGCVYVPQHLWYFKRNGGGTVLPTARGGKTPKNLMIVGQGPGAQLLCNLNVPGGSHFVELTSPEGTIVADLTIDRNATTGHALRVVGDGLVSPIGGGIFRTDILGGDYGLSLIGNGQPVRNVWLSSVNLTGAASRGLYAIDLWGATIEALRSDKDVYFDVAVNGQHCSDITISEMDAANFYIFLGAAVTYNSSLHGRIKAGDINCSGIVDITNIDQVELENAIASSITYALTKAGVGFSKFKCNGKVRDGSGIGLSIAVSGGASLSGFEILGGYYERKSASGIELNIAGAGAIKHGSIHDVVLRENGSVAGSGVRLHSDGVGQIQGILAHHNQFIDERGMGATQAYGFEESAGLIDRSIVDHNYFQGNVIAPYKVIGANTIVDANQEA